MNEAVFNPLVTGYRELGSDVAVDVGCALDHARAGVPVAPVHDMDGLRRAFVFRKRDCFQDAIGPLLHIDPGTSPAGSTISLGHSWGEEHDLSDHEPFRRADVRVRVLDFGGGFPTGSFKYLGMVQTIAICHALGARRVVLPSQGNAAVAAGEAVMRRPDLGMELCVLLPEDTPAPIVERVRIHGVSGRVRMESIDGNINVCGKAMRESWVPDGWVPIATGIEPLGARIVGKSFMAWRTAWQNGGALELPDYWFYPTGGGTGICGFAMARRIMVELGLIDAAKATRLVVVQSERNAALVRALEDGVDPKSVQRGGATLLTGLDVSGGAALHPETLRAVRSSGGFGVAVGDDETLACARALIRERGVLLGVEGYAAMAALLRAVGDGRIAGGASVVVVNTGAAENYGALASLER